MPESKAGFTREVMNTDNTEKPSPVVRQLQEEALAFDVIEAQRKFFALLLERRLNVILEQRAIIEQSAKSTAELIKRVQAFKDDNQQTVMRLTEELRAANEKIRELTEDVGEPEEEALEEDSDSYSSPRSQAEDILGFKEPGE